MDAPRRGGFTLIELIVVIALVAVLLGIVVVTVGGVRRSAGQTRSMGALRQVVTGYSSYTHDHGGRLLPGYVDSTLMAPGGAFERLRGKLPDGTELAGADLQSYVWRLAPYLDDAWQTFYQDAAGPGSIEAMASDYASGVYGPAGGPSGEGPSYPGGISERPTYGLNSIFVGGDSAHGGAFVTARHPWQDALKPVAATRLAQASRPGELVVFAPAALAGQPEDVYQDAGVGFCELRAPYLPTVDDQDDPTATWDGAQWSVDGRRRVVQDNDGHYADGAGLPIDRTGKGSLPVANLDASTGIEVIAELSRDMRRWSPHELQLRETAPPSPLK